MSSKRIKLLIASFILVAGIVQAQKSNERMDVFIDKLMQKMTLDEKIGQLNLPVSGEIVTGAAKSSDVAEKIRRGEVGGLFNLKGVDKIREVQKLAVENSRLGIPLLFGMDVIHGYETVFPIPLGLSCSWNMQAVEQSARIAAIEATADGINWTFSPMVDLARDPRWGRVAEGSGEDPYLGSLIAKAMVKGYQGAGLKNRNEMMACVKHFALYGAAEAGRDYNTVDMSRLKMYNEYFPPYQAAVQAGAGSVMASFNEVDGVPATANKWLMTDVLRKQWGFDGFVVTDFTGIAEMIEHGIGDLKTVSARSLNAGVDMDMVSDGFLKTLKQSIQEGKVSVATVNMACRRILEAKYKLGLFSDPYKYCDLNRPQNEIFTKVNRDVARRVAAESFVLLRNDKNLLPLQKKGRIALVGPLANNRANMVGTWSVAAVHSKVSTLQEGLQRAVGSAAEIVYAKGSNLVSDTAYERRATMFGRDLNRDTRSEQQLLDEALKVASQSDVVVAALGESSEMSGESSCRTNLDLPDVQQKLLKSLLATGKPVVLLVFAGRPLTLNWEQENIPAILNVWFGGSEAADAIADVLFGTVNPSGKLTMSFPKNVGQIPLYYAHKNTGRPLPDGKWFQKFRSNYLDVDNEPLYPFGYGLSYTHFAYGSIVLDRNVMTVRDSITATFELTNSGSVDGAEVVQLYLRDKVASVTRPVKELKGFKKIYLKAGQSQKVSFVVTENMLRFYNEDLKFVSEPGEFELMIGTNSRDVQRVSFSLQN